MLERLRGKDFPKRTEILQATAVLLLTINQEYNALPTSPISPPLSPMTTYSPSSPVFPLTTPPAYSNSQPALIPSPTTTVIHSPIPVRPTIQSALLGGPRSSSPSFSLRSSANAIMLSSVQTPPLSSNSPSASPDIRRNPPRSPSTHTPLPPLQRSISNLSPSSPSLPNRLTVNLSSLPAPPSPPHEMARTASSQNVNQNQVQQVTPSPQAPSQSPRAQAVKQTPLSPPSPTAKIAVSPPSTSSSLGGSPLTRSGSFTPSYGSAPCGLLGDWEATLEMLFKAYLSI